nr:p153 [Chinese wheat mosaic virus]
MPIDSSSILGIISEEDVIRAAISTSATKFGSQLHSTVCDHVKETYLDAMERQKTKKKIDVRRDLSQEQLQLLNDLYPERHIVSSNCERGTHSFAAASRKIETDLLLSRIPKKSWVYDIGGNWATHIKRNDGRRVHCCCPTIDIRDSARKTVRWASIEKYLDEKDEIPTEVGERIKRVQADEIKIYENLKNKRAQPEDLDGKWYCGNKFEECVFRAERAYAMAIHSIYDIDLMDLANALEEKRIKIMSGTFLFSVDLLLGKKSGSLPTMDGFFEVEGDYVKYGFKNDTNPGYKHKLSQLMKYLTKTFVVAKGGTIYYLELTEQRGDVMFFTMTDATEARMNGVVADESFKCIPIDNKSEVVFPIFEVDKQTDSLIFSEVLLSKDFVQRAIEYTGRLKPNQLTPDNVNTYLTSTNNTIIIGGSSRKNTTKVDATLIQQITTTLVVWTELMNLRQKRVLEKLRLQMKDDVDFKSLAHTAFLKVFGKVSYYQRALRCFANWLSYVHGTDAIQFHDVPLYAEITDRVKLWKTHAPNQGFVLDMEDLDVKIKMHEVSEREKRDVSRCIVSGKLGELQIHSEPSNNEEQTNGDYRDTRRRTTFEDLLEGEVATNFLDDWCEKNDHFNFSRDDALSKYAWGLKLLKGIWEFLLPPMDFAPVYVDDEQARLRMVHVNERRNTSDTGADGDVAACEVAADFSKAMDTLVDVVKKMDQKKLELVDKVKTSAVAVVELSKTKPVTGNSCAVDLWADFEKDLDDDDESGCGVSMVTKGKEVCQDNVGPVLLCGSSSRSSVSEVEKETDVVSVTDFGSTPAASCGGMVLDESVSVTSNDASVELPVTATTVATVETGNADAVIASSDESAFSDVNDKSWGSVAEEESDDTFYSCSGVISDKVKKSNLPKRPDFSKFPTVQQKAKHEAMWYLQCKIVSDRTTLRSIIDDHLRGMFHNGTCELPKDSAFLDYTADNSGTWMYGKPSRFGHSYGVGFSLDTRQRVSKCELVKLMWNHDSRGQVNQKPVNTRAFQYLLLSELSFMMNEMIIYRNLQQVMRKRERTKQARITLRDGVPGCGKSTWILNNANPTKDMILSVGKEATEDLKEKFMKKHRCVESDLKRIRTVDSFLMHDYDKYRAATVHFDEALMAHAGMVYFCADILGAKKVICQGDSQQIPFINRVESITLQYSKLVIDETEHVRLTYRSPVDVAHYLTKKSWYSGGRVTTKNPVMRSMKTVGPRDVKPMTSVHCVPYFKDAQYLTFTQSEKTDLYKALRNKGPVTVNTVHETQGKTFDDVIVVRLKTTENEIYPGGRKGQPYEIVATTRHRRSLVYYTAIEDRLFEDISDMQDVMESKLMKSLCPEFDK